MDSFLFLGVINVRIYYRHPVIKKMAPGIKIARFGFGRTVEKTKSAGNGRSSATALVIRDGREEQRESQKQKSPSMFNQQVLSYLNHKERKAYAKLKERKHVKNTPRRFRVFTVHGQLQKTHMKKGKNESFSSDAAHADMEMTGIHSTLSGSSAAGAGATVGKTSAGGTSSAQTASITAARAATQASTQAASQTASAVGSTATLGGAAAAGAATAGVSVVATVATKAASKTAEKFRELLAAQAAQSDMDVKSSAQLAAASKVTDATAKADNNVGIGSILSSVLSGAVALVSSLVSAVMSVVLLPILLIIALVAAIVSVIVAGVSINSRGGGDAVVAVARAEALAWEENIGGDKYKDWYGMDADWCAMFISWCANGCGYIDTGVFPKSASVEACANYFKSMDAFEYKGVYEPKAGDLIIYGATGSSHIGLVVDFDGETKVITTVEGNTGPSSASPYHKGSRVMEKKVSLSFSWIYGFCLPDYPMDVGSLSGNTNCEQAYNYFIALGYTQEAAAGIVGNLMQESGLTADGDLAVNTTAADGAVGICMWTYPPIRESFLNYALTQGEPWPKTSLKVQLDFLNMNMAQPGIWMWTSYASAYYPAASNISLDVFKRCTDIELATTAFCANYEKPDGNLAMLTRRIQFARQVYDAYAK